MFKRREEERKSEPLRDPPSLFSLSLIQVLFLLPPHPCHQRNLVQDRTGISTCIYQATQTLVLTISMSRSFFSLSFSLDKTLPLFRPQVFFLSSIFIPLFVLSSYQCQEWKRQKMDGTKRERETEVERRREGREKIIVLKCPVTKCVLTDESICLFSKERISIPILTTPVNRSQTGQWEWVGRYPPHFSLSLSLILWRRLWERKRDRERWRIDLVLFSHLLTKIHRLDPIFLSSLLFRAPTFFSSLCISLLFK